MREWRERVARAACRAHYGLGDAKLCKQYEDEHWPLWLPVADAAIAELLPLMKAELAKVARDAAEGASYGAAERMIAAIEAWEPQHD